MKTKIFRWLKRIFISLALLYIAACGYLYFQQESIIFIPTKLAGTYKYQYPGNYREMFVTTSDGARLNGLLFKADSCKGLVFYLHGNAGALDTWGEIADVYTGLQHDFFVMDYRGFGKSEGTISSEQQLYSDLQTAYDSLKKFYNEKDITIIGYSIGTGPAAMLASANHPARLILQAPYYNLSDMMRKRYPIVPTFLLNYKFPTNDFLAKTSVPVTIFHGTDDGIIYYGSSLKLKEQFKKGDTLITLPGARHNGLNRNAIYLENLKRVLK
ncbi:MAG: alpha/beta hydrolase fold protein [Bacteroidetes bacterium]|jgi:alpha-beta hydrolase superfamily lysophospholipase|nr:alpha/beta hydrolase fold protein [Bacteroidota bacterium]